MGQPLGVGKSHRIAVNVRQFAPVNASPIFSRVMTASCVDGNKPRSRIAGCCHAHGRHASSAAAMRWATAMRGARLVSSAVPVLRL